MYATLRCTAIVPGNLEQLGNTVLLLYRSTFVFFFSSWRYSSMNLFLNAHFEVQIEFAVINAQLTGTWQCIPCTRCNSEPLPLSSFINLNLCTETHKHQHTITHACTQPNIKLAFLGIQIGLDGTEKMTVQRVVFFGEWPLHLHLLIACCVMA